MNPPTFKCGVCGAACIVEPDEGPAVCPEHCEDHDYHREGSDGLMCLHCGAAPPPDYDTYDDFEDGRPNYAALIFEFLSDTNAALARVYARLPTEGRDNG